MPSFTMTENLSSKCRVIARMDIKTTNLIKGIQFEGLRVIGNPIEYARRYYEQQADELIYIDTVASLYDRSYMGELIRETAKEVFIPITVAGGIRSPQDAENLFRSGADKIGINTAAVKNPNILRDIAETFGNQAVVLQLDVKRTSIGFEVYIDCGREKTGLSALEWVKQAQDLGCGEILLTSIDRDGTRKGFDYEMIAQLAPLISVPLIVSGGYGQASHLDEILTHVQPDAIAIGSALHFNKDSIESIKASYKNSQVRNHA